MRVALFSDIHGHITGLRAVLARLVQLGGADVIYALGDFVGGGPGVEDVLDLLLEHQVKMLRGNWDEIFISLDEQLMKIPSESHPFVLQTYEWLSSKLSREYQGLLANLPLCATLELAPTQHLFMCHAAPTDPWARSCRPNMPTNTLRTVYGALDAKIVAYGHYHAHHVLHLDNKFLINVASVGLGWQGLSTLTLLEVVNEQTHIQQYQVPYDIDEHLQLIQKRKMPPDPAIWYW